MINTKQFFYFILSIVLISCSSGKRSNQIDNNNSQRIYVRDSIKIIKNLTFSYEIEVVKYSNTDYEFINENIMKNICLVFSNDCDRIDLTLSKKSVNNIASKHAELLQEDYSSEPNDYKPFEINYNYSVKEAYSKRNLLLLKKNLSSYTGGAHGNYNLQYTLYDSERGSVIGIKDLFNLTKLIDIGKENFLVSRGLQKGIELKKSGYWFKNDKFYLPNNFTIKDNNLIFIYNPYEIASYAEGIIEVKIPLNKLKDIIKEEYKFIIN